MRSLQYSASLPGANSSAVVGGVGVGGKAEWSTSGMAAARSQHQQKQLHTAFTSTARRSYLLGIGTNSAAEADRREKNPRGGMVADSGGAGSG